MTGPVYVPAMHLRKLVSEKTGSEWTACGRPFVRQPPVEMTDDPEEVTCGQCRRGTYFQEIMDELHKTLALEEGPCP